jgi:hypothetical protein
MRGLLLPLVVLVWSCGGKEGWQPPVDVPTDGVDVGDVLEDGEADVPADGEDAPGDAGDDGPTWGLTPFEVESAGGAKLDSTNFKLEVFVAPVRPVGDIWSTNYKFKLGPAGIRSQ